MGGTGTRFSHGGRSAAVKRSGAVYWRVAGWLPELHKLRLRMTMGTASLFSNLLRIWWNWQTRYFEVVVGQPVQVQVLLGAPKTLRKTAGRSLLTQF